MTLDSESKLEPSVAKLFINKSFHFVTLCVLYFAFYQVTTVRILRLKQSNVKMNGTCLCSQDGPLIRVNILRYQIKQADGQTSSNIVLHKDTGASHWHLQLAESGPLVNYY